MLNVLLLLCPCAMPPKLSAVGLTRSCAVCASPRPDIPIENTPLSVDAESVPAATPTAFGVKDTGTFNDWPAWSVAGSAGLGDPDANCAGVTDRDEIVTVDVAVKVAVPFDVAATTVSGNWT